MFMNYLVYIGRSQVAMSDLQMLTEQVNRSWWSFQNVIKKQWKVFLLCFKCGWGEEDPKYHILWCYISQLG